MKKLSPFEAYITLIKGYSVLSIMFLPKAFVNGGWLVSASFLTCSGILSCIGCCLLIDTGLLHKIYSYPLVVEKVLGKKARFFLDIAIALTQISIVISHATFLIESFKVTIDTLFDIETNATIYGVLIVVAFTMLSWVRNIAKFSFTFMLGVFLLLLTCFYVASYAGMRLRENGMGPDPMKFNPNDYITTIGITIYCYEGIGIVMPVMAACE